jgi:hypothetical protein
MQRSSLEFGLSKFYLNSILALIATTCTSTVPCLADKQSEPGAAAAYAAATQTASATVPTAIAVPTAPFSPEHKDGVHEQILIKASPKVVWQSMQEQRKLDPDSQYCKPAVDNLRPVVEQKFVFPSPFGDAECTLHLSETFAQRVDFRLIESEDLKKMEGCWTLTPQDNGQSTRLELSSYVDPYMCIPRILTNGVISHKVKKNLAMVKRIAEKNAEKSM